MKHDAPHLIVFLSCLLLATWMGCKPSSPSAESESAEASTSTEYAPDVGEQFSRLMNRGKTYYQSGNLDQALDMFTQAEALVPESLDLHLNLANTHLRAGRLEQAIASADRSLSLDDESAAAYFIKGCALLRQGGAEEASKALQESLNRDSEVAAAHFQLGRAHMALEHWEAALAAFDRAAEIQPNHRSVYYQKSLILSRQNRMDEANAAMETHQQIVAQAEGPQPTESDFEQCVHTEARAPFPLEQPDPQGIAVRYVDATDKAFGGAQSEFKGPIGVLDVDRRGHNDLFALGPEGFQLLMNTNGVFGPFGFPYPASPEGGYRQCLVADLENNRYQDVIVLGEQASHVYKFATNGNAMEVTAFCGLKDLKGKQGILVDLDFTGHLDLIACLPDGQGVKVYQNLGNLYFRDYSTSGVPAQAGNVLDIAFNDLNDDDLMDVVLASADRPPHLLIKQRGGPLAETSPEHDWPAARAITTGDFNNDLKTDIAFATDGQIVLYFEGIEAPATLSAEGGRIRELRAVDYDNDGWLDLWAVGDGVQAWRNAGKAGFSERTADLGFDALKGVRIDSFAVADFDCDDDSDFIFSTESGLRFWSNEGGDRNHLLKLRLIGNRSNASGLGTRLEIRAGGWRTIRTVTSLPVEIGTGEYETVDSVSTRWVNLAMDMADVSSTGCEPYMVTEIIMPTGSCPYLYAWDGDSFRFVTDLLGAAPLGLKLSESRLIESDPEEYVWIGDAETFPTRDGAYVIQITEELQEILYLDAAHLAVVDHPIGTEIYPTSKLLPGRPFPEHQLLPLTNPIPLKRAENLEGEDVTKCLRNVDGERVSPTELRIPHLRGLAKPHGVVLDFGELNADRPLTLAMTGWLHFGGGMANAAASLREDLPFPFPTLEVETADGDWSKLDVIVGAPAGKTKRMLVDLSGKLPKDGRRLRLSAAFEIHWDQIALYERADLDLRIHRLNAAETDLHWRGYGKFKSLPWHEPLTPDYENLRESAPWRLTPSGWCARYGEVDELLAAKDNALALIAGGDELTLKFDASELPELKPGMKRDIFLYTSGWDKDADPHVVRGRTVEPLPFHGMDDQRYGEEARPAFENDVWMSRYNTRWVGPRTIVERK